jgi:hypothetical protein
MFTEDISAFFNDAEFAVAAEFTPSDGGAPVSASVVFNAQAEQIFGDDVLSNEYTIVYPAGSLAGVKSGDSGTVNGVRYRMREIRLKADGQIKVARLSKQ